MHSAAAGVAVELQLQNQPDFKNRVENKSRTEYPGTPGNTVYLSACKSPREKDGPLFFTIPDPKVGGSIPPVATNFSSPANPGQVTQQVLSTLPPNSKRLQGCPKTPKNAKCNGQLLINSTVLVVSDADSHGHPFFSDVAWPPGRTRVAQAAAGDLSQTLLDGEKREYLANSF